MRSLVLLLLSILILGCTPVLTPDDAEHVAQAVSSTGTLPCGAYPGSSCRQATVTCNGLPPYTAGVVVTDPIGGPTSGTVVLLQGSGGQGIPSGPQWDPIVQGLTAAGRRVVRLGGAAGASWEQGGVAEGSCRIAELVGWVRSTLHIAGPLCGLGSSGGASALTYVMALHDGAALLDGIVLANGAPLTRLTSGCMSPAGTTIPNSCPGAPHLAQYPQGTAAGIDGWETTTSCADALLVNGDVARWTANDDAFNAGATDWGDRTVAVTCSGTATAHGQLELLHSLVGGIGRTCVGGCSGEAVLSYPPGRTAVLAAVLACGT